MEFVLNGKVYEVVKFLGKGKGGYSYLVTDGVGRYTLKQIHHEPCDCYTFGDKLASELRDHERLRSVGIPIPELRDKVLDDAMVPDYYEQVRGMCRRLYPAGLNIDYFPANFIVQEGKLWYIDYECNVYDARWDFEHWGNDYWWKSPVFLEYAQSRK